MGMHLRTRYDWNKLGRPGIAVTTRIGGALIAGMAALSWPVFLFLAVARNWTVIFAPLVITTGAVVQRGAMRRVYGVPAEPEPGTEPEADPRVPADMSRPYPRGDSAATEEQLQTCPICGMDDLDQMIPYDLADFFGWPAHASCKEWLGDWKPAMFKPLASVQPANGGGEAVWCANGTAATLVFTTKGAVPVAGSAATSHVSSRAAADEARERLNREIVAAWGVPPAMLQEHVHQVGDPVPSEQCPKCGARFLGTPEYLREAFTLHQQVGCRQSSSSLA